MKSIGMEIAKKDRKCRICNTTIKKDQICFALRGIMLPAKNVNLFFHEACMAPAWDLRWDYYYRKQSQR